MKHPSERLSWQDVRNDIRGKILNSTYKPGDKLPRDEDIAQQLQCARTTVHRAMRFLADEGLIERRRKGGTMVKTNPIKRAILEIPITRIEIETLGWSYQHRLLEREILTASPSLLTPFPAQDNERLLHLKAVHLADNQPYILEDRWISLTTTPAIESVDFNKISANEWLVRHRPYSHCDMQIYATIPNIDEAKFMSVEKTVALLALERTTWIEQSPITHLKALHAPGYRLLSNN